MTKCSHMKQYILITSFLNQLQAPTCHQIGLDTKTNMKQH